MAAGDRDALLRAACTSLGSKVVSQYSGLLAPMAVDALLAVADAAHPELLDLRDVKVGGGAGRGGGVAGRAGRASWRQGGQSVAVGGRLTGGSAWV